MAKIRNHFSGHADDYSRYRPHYPAELYDYLADLCSKHSLVWDCATGNGQAARGLSEYFQHIYASDISPQQLNQAPAKNNITYREESAYNCSLENDSTDLITVAQAVHWFDLPDFYAEAKRVLKPDGVIALWTYDRIYFKNEELNRILSYFYNDLVVDYWSFDRSHIENGYSTLDFPFAEINTPKFTIRHEWDAQQVINYLYTWSSVRNYMKQNDDDPIEQIKDELWKFWGDENDTRSVLWDLHLRVGR